MINNRAQLHDSLLNYMSSHAYNLFGGHVHLIDPQIAPLRELLNQELPSKQRDTIWNLAISQNKLYDELLRRFGNSIHNALFIKKVGDFVLDINSIWHLIEVKTSTRASGIYHFNFDSFAALRRLPREVRKYVHILFYNDVFKTYHLAPFNEIKFDPIYYHFPELSLERKNEVEEFLINHVPTVNVGQVDNDIERKTNVYLSIDIYSEENRKVVCPIEQYLDKLKLNAVIWS